MTTSKPKRPFDLWFSENLEALAVSVAMALVLKFFVVEAYQIPTGSMQPTILGDRRTGIKDRILADKLVTMLRPPRRWEVMIFRFPLDERRLYVKRIVGLPGETLEVRGGDVWIDGAIARKPDHVNASVLKAILPGSDGALEIGRLFAAEGAVTIRGAEASVPAGEAGELRLKGEVMDEYLHGYEPGWGIAPERGAVMAVADLEVTLQATLAADAAALRVRFENDDEVLEVVLPREGSGEAARAELRPAAGPASTIPMEGAPGLAPGETVPVTVRWVDRRLVVEVDGEEWLRHDDDASGPRTDTPRRSRVSLGLDGGGTLAALDLRRDIHYWPSVQRTSLPPRWEIPEDSYFGMGDNTQSSHDGRGWETVTYTLADGRELTGFWFMHRGPGPAPPDANPKPLPGNQLEFADVHGDVHVFRIEDIVGQTVEPAPFIHRRYLLGKASLVFWPVLDPFRWKFIR